MPEEEGTIRSENEANEEEIERATIGLRGQEKVDDGPLPTIRSSEGRLDVEVTENVAFLPEANETRTPEGGWGWMCVLGCCLVHVLLGGYGRSYGMIYQRLMTKYNSSAAFTAWVGGTSVAVRMGFSPLSNALSRKYGARKVVFIGGIILGIGSVLNAFANSTEFFFFSYSMVAGIGGSLVYSPSLVIIGEYFTKNRGIAMSFSTCGSGIGAFLFPQLMHYLFSTYGFRGGLLILGALEFNSCISGLLYRPLKKFDPVIIDRDINVNEVTSDVIPLKKYSSNESIKYSSTKSIKYSSTKSVDYIDDVDVKVGTQTEAKPRCSLVAALFKVANFLDMSIWKDSSFVLLALSQGLSVMSYLPLSTFIPAISVEQGLSQVDATMILSSVALGDTVGRLFSGFIFDLRIFSRTRYIPFSLCMASSSFLIFVWPYLHNVQIILVNGAIFGVLTGVTIAQRTTILCDLVGADRLSGSHGMLVFTQGLCISMGPVIAGKLRDIFGNYNISFHFLSVLMFIAGLFSIAAGISSRRTSPKPRNKEELG